MNTVHTLANGGLRVTTPDGAVVVVTQHALDRMKQMAASADDVMSLVLDPAITYPGSREHANNGRVHQNPTLPVAAVIELAGSAHVVLTVIPYVVEDYARPEAL